MYQKRTSRMTLKEKKENVINRIKEYKLVDLYYKYHVSEIVGIITSFVMMIITFIPVLTRGDSYQIPVALFFLEMLLIRLALFIWYNKTKNNENAKFMQALMMLLTAILLFLSRAIYLYVVAYNLFVNHKLILNDYTLQAVAYGIYTFGKIVLAVYGLIQNRKINLYKETLSYVGWISAIYTLALFVNYLLLASDSNDLMWMKSFVLLLMALSTIVLITIMLVKSIKNIRAYKKAKAASV